MFKNMIRQDVYKRQIYTAYSPKEENKKLQLPLASKTNEHATDYLMRRGIEHEIIQDLSLIHI